MKRFKELTTPQQNQAVTFAIDELKDCIERGIVHFDRPITDEVLLDYAECAANEAWYSQPSDKIIADIVDNDDADGTN